MRDWTITELAKYPIPLARRSLDTCWIQLCAPAEGIEGTKRRFQWDDASGAHSDVVSLPVALILLWGNIDEDGVKSILEGRAQVTHRCSHTACINYKHLRLQPVQGNFNTPAIMRRRN